MLWKRWSFRYAVRPILEKHPVVAEPAAHGLVAEHAVLLVAWPSAGQPWHPFPQSLSVARSSCHMSSVPHEEQAARLERQAGRSCPGTAFPRLYGQAKLQCGAQQQARPHQRRGRAYRMGRLRALTSCDKLQTPHSATARMYLFAVSSRRVCDANN